MKTKTALLTFASLMTASVATADVDFGVIYGGLNDSAGNAPASSMRTVLYVDSNGTGAADFASWDGTGWLPDASDLLIFDDQFTGDGNGYEAAFTAPDSFAVIDALSDATVSIAVGTSTGESVADAGDAVWLLWFPNLALSATEAGAGTSFGAVQVGVVPENNFGLVSPFIETPTNAEFTTVPEPSSLALLGLGGLAMLRRRRG
ncbi:MAG: PEP-CTERM sorting domain-containing protein [Phycisphaeraceae bacterium]|nr:PEP-CTERM sorting domain-containing protein [Phycisphaeraceae bacterium]